LNANQGVWHGYADSSILSEPVWDLEKILDRSARNPFPRKFALQIGPKAAEEIKKLEAQPSI